VIDLDVCTEMHVVYVENYEDNTIIITKAPAFCPINC